VIAVGKELRGGATKSQGAAARGREMRQSPTLIGSCVDQ
jgi:hypothetical protein